MEIDTISQMINYAYSIEFDEYNMFDKDLCTEKWEQTSLEDQKSSTSQAMHIKNKLSWLGFKCEHSMVSTKELLKINRDIIDRVLGINKDYYKKVKILSKDKSEWGFFDFKGKLPIEELARIEHNRWNVYHQLNGWIYGEKDKVNKVHNCLKPLKEFEDTIKPTILYDLYTILYIPNYLAGTGFIITK